MLGAAPDEVTDEVRREKLQALQQVLQLSKLKGKSPARGSKGSCLRQAGQWLLSPHILSLRSNIPYLYPYALHLLHPFGGDLSFAFLSI